MLTRGILSANDDVSISLNDQHIDLPIDVNTCFHCLEPMPKYGNLSVSLNGIDQPMCCVGCQAAAEFISERKLTRFYEHRDRLSQKNFFAKVANHRMELLVLDTIPEQWRFLDSPTQSKTFVTYHSNGCREFTVVVKGMYCSSCTWLIERALSSVSSKIEFQADIDSRSIHLWVSDENLKISKILNTIACLGYRPSVPETGDVSTSLNIAKQEKNKAIRRILVAGFGMMQVMTYATASYFGGSVDAGSVNVMKPEFERFFLILSMLVSTVVVFYSGKPFFANAISDLRNWHLGMDVPVALAIAGAYFPSVYHVLMHIHSHVYFDSAVMFIFFLSLGRFVEMRARHRLSGSSTDVNQLLPRQVEVQRELDNQTIVSNIKPVDVIKGDKSHLCQFDIVPFDGIIISGTAQVDESHVTGEATELKKLVGDQLIACSRIVSGKVVVQANTNWNSSSIAQIKQSLIAASRSDQTEQQRSRLLSRYFILAILLLTLIVGCVWLLIEPERVFEICLAVLIASCPCAFSLASPVGRSAAIHFLRRKGVLLTNNKVLSTLTKITYWCFDKTGTLTQGRSTIRKVNCKSTLSEIECLQIIASLEQSSEHVLARAFKHIKTDYYATQIAEKIGYGIEGLINGVRYRVGKRSWVANKQVLFDAVHSNSEMVLTSENELLATIELRDEVRASSQKFLSNLKSTGFNVEVLSGDNLASVQTVCNELGIEKFSANLAPSEKLQRIEYLQSQGQKVIMVGDGVNDAPVLAAADVSIAMASGSELALNNADVVLLNGNLSNLTSLIEVSNNASKVTKQNLRWALIYNMVALPLAATGLLTPWIAALGMSLSSLLVVLNALRVRTS